MRLSLIVGFLCLFFSLPAADLQLAKDGKTDYTIVYTAKEKFAAEELKLHLDQMTKADFRMVEDSVWKDEDSKPAFYLGTTKFAKKQNLPTEELKTEEFNLQTVGKNIVITGGLSRGTLYGVYDLLERFGCRWFAYDTTVIPEKNELKLGTVKHRHNPSFAIRQFSDDYYRSKSRGKEIHQKTVDQKRRIRATVNLWSPVSNRYGTSHTFYQFVNPNVYFEKHPEYFSMDANGKRFRGTALGGWEGGGICMTNPDVLEITWKKLVEYIELDRKELPREKWPLIYDISMQDAIPYLCYCPECKKISKREESEAGLLIHFLNQIGARLKEKYPELMIKTLAYVDCSKAPKHISPLDNLIFQWCNLYTVNDCFRPITHKFNKAQKEEFDGWRKIGANTALWEYWNMGGRYFSPLRVETCFDGIAENLRYFHKNGAINYFCEFTPDYDRQHSQNFAFLNLYVAYKLLYDISLNEEELVKDFMPGYYGPAAKPMTEFMNLVRAELKKVDMPLPAFEMRRPYCTEDFMKKVWGYIEESLRLTEPGSLYRAHVEMEMLAPMSVILRNGYQIGDREFMIKEFRRIRSERIESTKVNPTVKQSYRDQMEAEMVNFIQLKLEVPEQFKGKNIVHIGWPKIGWSSGNKPGTYVDDPEAAGGKTVAVRVTKKFRHDMDQKETPGFTPLDFGFYDKDSERQVHKSYDKDSIPQDEKYHWYRVGQFELGENSILWGFYWTLQANLSAYYRIADGIRNANFVTGWVHLKITGPAYVKDSKKENGIFVDQIILVRPKGK